MVTASLFSLDHITLVLYPYDHFSHSSTGFLSGVLWCPFLPLLVCSLVRLPPIYISAKTASL